MGSSESRRGSGAGFVDNLGDDCVQWLGVLRFSSKLGLCLSPAALWPQSEGFFPLSVSVGGESVDSRQGIETP